MKKLGWLAALVAGICLLAILFAPRSGSAGPSSLSASKSGWAAARRYLELEGCRSSSNGRPLSSAHLEGTLVIALPEDGLRETEDLAAMVRHVRAGGDILLAFSGERVVLWLSRALSSAHAHHPPTTSPLPHRP